MSTLKQKFKRILKSDRAKMRDITIIISEYFTEIGFVDMSPLEIKEQSTHDQILHNFFLARAYYAKQFHKRLRRKDTEKPTNPTSGQFWTDYDWNVWHFDEKTHHWAQITTPLHPGKDIFEHEIKDITSEDLLNQINELEDKNRKKAKDS